MAKTIYREEYQQVVSRLHEAIGLPQVALARVLAATSSGSA
ncbi:MAG: hypothetical protein QM599_08850 [Pseudoxanthomonas sp.]